MGLTKILSGEPLPIAPPNQSPEMTKFFRDLLNYLRRLTAKFTGTNIETTLNEEVATFAPAPIGAIVLWSDYDGSGIPQNIPTGWALCDGQDHNGVTTLDLRGKFVVGYNSGDVDYDDCTNTGGSATVTFGDHTVPLHNHSGITGAEVSPHVHTYADDAPVEEWKYVVDVGTTQNVCVWFHGHSGTTGEGAHIHSMVDQALVTLTHAPQNNRPPYRVLAYIQRIA